MGNNSPAEAAQAKIKTGFGQAPTATEKKHLLDEINAFLKLNPKTSPIHLLSARRAQDERDPNAAANQAIVITVDYRDNVATRWVIDVPAHKVVSHATIAGHPQSSKEERDAAEKLIRADMKLGAVLKGGAHLAGGFVLDPPKEVLAKNPKHRYLKYDVCSADNKKFLWLVYVDLTTNSIPYAVEVKK